MRRLNGIDQVQQARGQELGIGSWHQITQAAISAFAEVTQDRQWIHIDEARASGSSYGSTIAHGYFTLSLLPHLLSDAFEFTGFRMKINYGLEQVRFPSPVRVDSRIRARAELAEVVITPRGARITVRNTIAIEGNEAPACVADTVSLLVS